MHFCQKSSNFLNLNAQIHQPGIKSLNFSLNILSFSIAIGNNGQILQKHLIFQ